MSTKQRLVALERQLAAAPKANIVAALLAARSADRPPRWTEAEALAVRDDPRAPHRLRAVAAACLRSRRLRPLTVNDLV